MDLKPIETVYNGYRFRSRLEARFAVFFDSLGIAYEYEKEGYELKSGLYLPDFYLPGLNHWAEIKGQWPNAEEEAKAKDLAIGSGKIVMILTHLEPDSDQIAFVPPTGLSGSGIHPCSLKIISDCMAIVRPVCFGQCDSCGKIYLHESHHAGTCYEFIRDKLCLGNVYSRTPCLLQAYSAARSARFEHGEKPRKGVLL